MEIDGKIKPLLKHWWRYGAFVLFLFIGLFLSAPCLCAEGEVKGMHKTILLFIFAIWLLADLFHKKMKLFDYGIYFLVLVGFLIWVEYQ